MPGHFKKRRGAQGPNKNEQKVMRARHDVLGSRFPQVKSLRVKLTFLDARQLVLEETSSVLGPSDEAVLTAQCPGRCGHGSFNFAAAIANAAGAKLPSAESSAKCAEPLFTGSAEACGCEARLKIELVYSQPQP